MLSPPLLALVRLRGAIHEFRHYLSWASWASHSETSISPAVSGPSHVSLCTWAGCESGTLLSGSCLSCTPFIIRLLWTLAKACVAVTPGAERFRELAVTVRVLARDVWQDTGQASREQAHGSRALFLWSHAEYSGFPQQQTTTTHLKCCLPGFFTGC